MNYVAINDHIACMTFGDYVGSLVSLYHSNRIIVVRPFRSILDDLEPMKWLVYVYIFLCFWVSQMAQLAALSSTFLCLKNVSSINRSDQTATSFLSFTLDFKEVVYSTFNETK